jgi:ABC-type transport system involved in multi-copper enzyme maturation permease subunit
VTTVEQQRARPTPGETELPSGPPLWRIQIRSVMGLELRRSLLGRRGLGLYLLASVPIFTLAVITLVSLIFGEAAFANLEEAREGFAYIYQILVLRMIVFFGCVAVFSNLIRGEILQRSLHYFLLCAIRRPVLVVGKYLAGVAQTALLFCFTVVVCYALLYLPYGLERSIEDLFRGPGLGQLLAYVGITVLACVGYGAMFLAVGLLIKNPVLPAVALFFWELLHVFLPPTLKPMTVVHYLKALTPVPVDLPLIAVVADPPPAIASVLGLLIFASALVTAAALLSRRMEIKYTDD